MAVRRGVAVGGDGRLLPAAARPARLRRPTHAVADAGALRPARSPGVAERFAAFVGKVRRYTHARTRMGCAPAGTSTSRARSNARGATTSGALERFDRCGGDLLGALAPYAQWTSSATHAVLPLLATDAGVRAQVQTGVESHRARFAVAELAGRGGRAGSCRAARRAGLGAGVPAGRAEPGAVVLAARVRLCAVVDPALADAGVRATCVELTGRFGLGAREHLRPLLSEEGVTFVPIDRATMELVWSDGGYPASGAYRDYHSHTEHHHNPWGNDGEDYDHERARRARAGARRGLRRPHPRAPAPRRRRPARRRSGGVRAGHRAARTLVVRGPRLARGGRGGVRAAGARARAAGRRTGAHRAGAA